MNRYSTAAAVAGQPDFAAATTAILATGETFPDALAASGLAGVNPIVLTASNEYSSEAQDALAALGSLTTVIIVGGTAAISQAVEDAVVADGYAVTRVAGADRYETAAAIAAELGSAGAIDGLTTAFIATGTGFADALAGGPLAAANGMPILLVTADEVPASTEAALVDLGIEQVAILGGTAAVSDDVETALETIVGNPAVRVAGTTRFGTAAAAGEFGVAELAWPPVEVLLANGLNFPDALSGGPLGGIRQAPILLLASVPQETSDFLNLHSDTIERIQCLGGTAACSEEDLQTSEAAGEDTTTDAATGGDTQTAALQGPELQSAAISGLDIEELAITYTYTFDTQLDENNENPELFKLYNTDSRTSATGDTFALGDEMAVDGETAVVVFNLADYGVANATLAAVAEGAVEDEAGNPNPPQSVATSAISDSSSASLLGATLIDDGADGIVEFEFSSPAIPGTEPGSYYQLITKEGYTFSGTELDATEAVFGEANAETYPQDDEPSTSVRVQFECNGLNSPAQYADPNGDLDTTNDPCSDAAADGDPANFSDENIRRAVVGDATTASTRIQVTDVSSSGTTDGPDLANVLFAADDDTLDDNQVLFVFDEAIDSIGLTPSPAKFSLIYSHCSPVAFNINDTIVALDAANADETYDTQDGQGFDDDIMLGTSCIVTPDSVDNADTDDFNDKSIIATFDEDYVLDTDFLLAAQVNGDAVPEEDPDGLLNKADEIEFGSSQPASLWDDGEVSGPQLVEASVELDLEFDGVTFQAWILTLTFDKDIDDAAIAGGIQFWFDDGENVEVDDLACTVEDDRVVECQITDEDSDFANATVVSLDAGVVDGADVFTLDSTAETAVQFPNPEASIEVEVPAPPA